MALHDAQYVRRVTKLQRDIALLVLSVAIALLLIVSGASEKFVLISHSFGLLGAFLAGVGFASAFFAAPATVVIFSLAQHHLFWLVAIIAAFGAMVGDWLVFKFLRDGIADDFRFLVEQTQGKERLKTLARSRLFYWLSSFIGALIIASPIPDEIGLAIFGLLRFNTQRFLPISFALNFLGIFIITLLAQLPE